MDLEPNFLTDILNLLLFPLFALQSLWDVLSQAARAIGFLP